MDNKRKYCIGCDHLAFADFENKYCYLGYNVKYCPIAKHNKQIAEYEKAKAELKREIENPFIKFLDWIENKLERIEKWWHNG